MPAKRLREFLDEQHVKYLSIQHSPAYTAQEVAQSVHVSGREMAKSIILVVDGQMVMAVLPASRKILLHELEEELATEDIRFATEEEFKERFPDCETGAMPPFGNLYGLPVYVAPGLPFGGDITFNAGTHTEVIRMAYRDFENIVHPRHASFST
jgi:Ala-tRNA(Pro) deacylase